MADDLPAALAARLTSSGGGAPGWPLHEFDRGGCTFYRHPTAPETVARFTYAELAASIRPTAAHVEEARTYAEARRSMIEDEHSDPAGARPSEWARLASRDRLRIEKMGRALCARVLAENEQGALL